MNSFFMKNSKGNEPTPKPLLNGKEGISNVMASYSSRCICGVTSRFTYAGTGRYCWRDHIYSRIMDCLEAKVGDLRYYWP